MKNILTIAAILFVGCLVIQSSPSAPAEKQKIALVTAATGALAKTTRERIFYSKDRAANAKENIRLYDWAREVQERIFKKGNPLDYYCAGPEKYVAADTLAELSDEFLWLLQPTTRIARVIPQEAMAYCPVCGDQAKKINVWNPFRIDPLAHPYKVQCQMCKNWFPTSDYAKGDLTSGNLPDNGDGGIYTGEGPGKGKKFFFLREYAHMCYGTMTVPALKSLGEAYVLTDDRKYARAGCILMARLASEYPNYGWKGTGLDLENRFDRTYLGPWKNQHPRYDWKHGGMITDLIWETFNLESTAYAYDALRGAMDDPEVIAFVKAKGLPVEDGDDLRRYIENYIFRAGMLGLLKGEIHGNEGHHQAAAMAVALVMDDYGDTHPNSKDMVDYAYHTQHAAYILVNTSNRDGSGHESPGYNRIKLDFIRVNRLMEDIRRRHPGMYPPEKYPDLFANPKARAIFDYHIDMMMDNCFIPSIGDAGGIAKPQRNTNRQWSFLSHENFYAVERYNDARFARACTDAEGAPLAGELWGKYSGDKIKKLLEQPESRIVRKSRLLDGYGVAILEAGERPLSRAAYLNYSALRGHCQNDNLKIGLFAFGVDLLPDLGYPRTWNHRWQWDANSLAHNTVTVDETQYLLGQGGNMGRMMALENGVHVMTASCDAYPANKVPLGRKNAPKCDLFERTLVMVDVDARRFYLVDLFLVNGGEQHDQSWHSMLVKPEAPELPWRVQEKGTLAGVDVPEFSAYTDRWGRTNLLGKYESRQFAGFLTNIRRAPLAAPAAWTWKSGLPEGDTLRIHVMPLGGPAEVIMGEGRNPEWFDEKLPIVLVRRQSPEGKPSRFLSVLEAFQKTPVITGTRVLSEDPLTLEITRADGKDLIRLYTPAGPSATTSHRPVGVQVTSLNAAGAETRNVQIGKCGTNEGPGYIMTRVADVNYEAQKLAVPYQPGYEAAFPTGRYVRVFNEGQTGLYRIMRSEREDKKYWLTLDTTALFARAPVKNAESGKVFLDASLIFATGQTFAGAWLGEGTEARKVKAATTDGVLNLTDGALRDYGGRVVSVWHYGIGDSVEAVQVK